MTMCGSVDGVYLALIGDGALGPALSERHGSWSNSGKRRTKVAMSYKYMVDSVLPSISARSIRVTLSISICVWRGRLSANPLAYVRRMERDSIGATS